MCVSLSVNFKVLKVLQYSCLGNSDPVEGVHVTKKNVIPISHKYTGSTGREVWEHPHPRGSGVSWIWNDPGCCCGGQARDQNYRRVVLQRWERSAASILPQAEIWNAEELPEYSKLRSPPSKIPLCQWKKFCKSEWHKCLMQSLGTSHTFNLITVF